VVWLKGESLASEYSLRVLLVCWIKISAPVQMIRIALLRPWPFSSTTVALASCSSEPFPKERQYISETSGRDALRRRPGSHLSRIAGDPLCALHSLHREVWGLLPPTAVSYCVYSRGLARQAEAAQSRAAAMQEHGPRHHSRMGGRLDTAGREPERRVADVSSRSAAQE
jgi:hypothetical protein